MSNQPSTALPELPVQIVDRIGRQDQLDGLDNALATNAEKVYALARENGVPLKDMLHGTWLGHPLHPVLTDIPIGAWTVVAVLDGLEGTSRAPGLRRANDTALVVGLLGAFGAAVSGTADWTETDGEARRVGLVHGLLNAGATGLYAAALLSRWRKKRAAGRRLSLLGYALVTASAYLGGDLVYRQRIGVNHAETPPSPEPGEEYVDVLAADELSEGEMRRVDVAGVGVMLARQNDQIFALGERCAHLGGPLSEGDLEPGMVRCPWHGSTFALESGSVIDGPATYPQPCYGVRVSEGRIAVRIPS